MIKKLEYEDGFLMENLLTKINDLIDEVEDQNQRINRLWKFLRKREEKETTKNAAKDQLGAR